MLYMVAMLPLGIAYFTIVVAGLGAAFPMVVLPIGLMLGFGGHFFVDGLDVLHVEGPWVWPASVLGGVLLLFVTLHVARGIGRLHGQLAKHLLVKTAQYS